MTQLVFDEPGSRTYEVGVDRAVIYLRDGRSVVWNGITSIEEDSNRDVNTYYIDGRPFLHTTTLGTFEGSLTAYTYPDEVLTLEGVMDVGEYSSGNPGFLASHMPPQLCNLAYRTKISSDLDSDLGYKLHLLYNVLLTPDVKTYATLSLDVEPTDFVWKLRTVPDNDMRVFSHIVFDSRVSPYWWMDHLEAKLYGTNDTAPTFPDNAVSLIWEHAVVIGEGPPAPPNGFAVTVLDNGDGSWTAIDTNGEIVNTNGVFTITNVDAVNVTPDSYDLNVG